MNQSILKKYVSKNPLKQFKVHHLGCAVNRIEEACKIYCDTLGFEIMTGPVELAAQRIRVCFINIGNNCLLELVESIGDKSPVSEILKKNGNCLYHICYQVENIDQSIKMLISAGFTKLRFTRVNNFYNYDYIYLIAPDNQLIELCSASKNLNR